MINSGIKFGKMNHRWPALVIMPGILLLCELYVKHMKYDSISCILSFQECNADENRHFTNILA